MEKETWPNTLKFWITAKSQPVPADGLSNQIIDSWSNRKYTPGYEYDLAGNLVRGQDANGNWQRYDYDTGGCLTRVWNDDRTWIQQDNAYGADRRRVKSWSYASVDISWYIWGGDSVIAEYQAVWEQNDLTWKKNYIYAGSRLLSTYTNNGQGGEVQEFHHPDRLGTKLVTNNQSNTSFEQSTLPFGTAMPAESSGFSNQAFTSYDRSPSTGLDYAVNRTYSPGQGRFTQVDPIGMGATSLGNPQSFNLYAYVRNNPVDFVDPSGLNLEEPNDIVRIERAVVYYDRPSWFSTYWDSYFGANNGGSVDGDTGRRGPDDDGTVSSSSDGVTIKDKDVKEFFKAFPSCFNLLQAALGDQFSDFIKSLNEMKFVDLRKKTKLLDKTLTELAIPQINDDGSLSELSGTLGDWAFADAITSPETNTAYLFESFFNESSVGKGAIKVHEQFHKFFSANHGSLLKKFGIKQLPPLEITFANPPFTVTSTQRDGEALTSWLKRGCTN